MCGTQRLASATALMRFQTLPPSEMKLLYESISNNAVERVSYVRFSMITPTLVIQYVTLSRP
jgi:hypothetical protein